jgi:Large polyvalent protein associated domain 29
MTAAERKAIGDNIRTALRTEFPSTEFSVRVFRHGYWGTTFGVRWAEGPSEEQVRQIADVLKPGAGVEIYYAREVA